MKDYRTKVERDILSLSNQNLLLILPTGFGKSKMALDIMHLRCKVGDRILVVVPKNVLKDNWKEEFKKWGYEDYLPCTTFVTYVSFPKVANEYQLVIFDEVHHLTERCQDSLDTFIIHNTVMLSATVGREFRYNLATYFPNLYIYKVRTREAIDEDILPDPRVYLIPMTLDNTKANCDIVKNKSKGNTIVVPYAQRWNYKGVKNRKIIIKCTQQEYYNDISNLISYYKNKMFMEIFKNRYLYTSGDRLKWLSNQKTAFVHTLLDHLNGERTLTFCNSIGQTEELGKYCINSKNKNSDEILSKFNSGKINHITACAMLDEGVNLSNCRIGVYANLNSSIRMIKQRLGRLLRHKDPIIIIPYFINTRDEEIVNKMCADYNAELVSTITNINNIQL